MDIKRIEVKSRGLVRKILDVVELIGAVSVYLYGKEYGFVYNNIQFIGLIED